MIACGAGSPRCRAEDHGPSQHGRAWRSSMLSCLTLYLCIFLGLIVVAIASNTFQGNPLDLQSGKLQLRRIPSGVRQASGVSGLKQRLLKQTPETICVQDIPKSSSCVRHDPDALHLEAVPVEQHQDFCGKGSTTLQSQSLLTMT